MFFFFVLGICKITEVYVDFCWKKCRVNISMKFRSFTIPKVVSPVFLGGDRLYFCVSKPSSGRRLHESETDSCLTNGSCAMSLNSNHVVLNTMPNVFVDVGLPIVEV